MRVRLGVLSLLVLLVGLAVLVQGSALLAHAAADLPAARAAQELPAETSPSAPILPDREDHDPEACSLCLALGSTRQLAPPCVRPTPCPALPGRLSERLAPESRPTRALPGGASPRAPPTVPA